MTRDIVVRPARENDAGTIRSVLRANLDDLSLFQRPEHDIRNHFGDFILVQDGGRVVGCAALHAYSASLAEVLSVSVVREGQGKGIGERLVGECLEKARRESVSMVFLATTKPAYFGRFGFRPFSHWQLPLRVLLTKLRQVFRQPAARWLPAVFGGHTFMRLRV